MGIKTNVWYNVIRLIPPGKTLEKQKPTFETGAKPD